MSDAAEKLKAFNAERAREMIGVFCHWGMRKSDIVSVCRGIIKIVNDPFCAIEFRAEDTGAEVAPPVDPNAKVDILRQ